MCIFVAQNQQVLVTVEVRLRLGLRLGLRIGESVQNRVQYLAGSGLG